MNKRTAVVVVTNLFSFFLIALIVIFSLKLWNYYDFSQVASVSEYCSNVLSNNCSRFEFILDSIMHRILIKMKWISLVDSSCDFQYYILRERPWKCENKYSPWVLSTVYISGIESQSRETREREEERERESKSTVSEKWVCVHERNFKSHIDS